MRPRRAGSALIPPSVLSDCRFPVDVERAKRDHSFLDRDALDSLCRWLRTCRALAETRLNYPSLDVFRYLS